MLVSMEERPSQRALSRDVSWRLELKWLSKGGFSKERGSRVKCSCTCVGLDSRDWQTASFVCTPSFWNNLPLFVCSSISIATFKNHLKTHLLTWPFSHGHKHAQWLFRATGLLYWFCCWTLIWLSHHCAWLCWGSWCYSNLIDWLVWCRWPGWEWWGKHGLKINRLFFMRGFVGQQSDREHYSNVHW